MFQFKAEIIADSVNPNRDRITTFLLTYPRFIHSELMTHRVFSRNASSSRAIPIEKTMRWVESNPAGPIRWGKNGKGMQDHGEFLGSDRLLRQFAWKEAARQALRSAKLLQELDLHKQIVNRVLEPFMWMTTLVTTTEYENFFALRLHKDAQPEFQHLAHLMLKAYLQNEPVAMNWGEWHVPFGDRMPQGTDHRTRIKIAVARAARTSYACADGEIDVEKDIAMHDGLATHGHWSPFEHPAQADIAAWNTPSNVQGWRQYRKNFPSENRKCDLNKLLAEYEASLPTEQEIL